MNQPHLLCAIFSCLVILGGGTWAYTAESTSRKPVDSLASGAAAWSITPAQMEKKFPRAFIWLDTASTLARFDGEKPRLSWQSLDVGETVASFEDGKLATVEISIFSRADGPPLTAATFEDRINQFSRALDTLTATAGEKRSRRDNAARADGLLWRTKDTHFLLEFSAGRTQKTFRPEFIKLTVFPPGREPTLGVERSRLALARKVKRESGSIWIQGVPMIDQGRKGYCAVASLARILRYYGSSADMHEMAILAGSKSASGTTLEGLLEGVSRLTAKLKLGKRSLIEIDQRAFINIVKNYNRAAASAGKEQLPVEYVENNTPSDYFHHMDPAILKAARAKEPGFLKFKEEIATHIERGVPLLWALLVGIYPEKNLNEDYQKSATQGDLVTNPSEGAEPTAAESPVPAGIHAHVRLIIGHDKEMKNLLYTDSWGRGHELKSMSMEEAYAATMGLLLIAPSR